MTKIFLLFLPWILCLAAPPPGTEHFAAAQLKAHEGQLAKNMKDGLASETLATWGNHLILQAHRSSSGQAEFHEKQADVLIVREGRAMLVIGGKVVGGKVTAPGEIRGTSIEGGERFSFNAGDVAHIPVRTAHRVLVEPGQTVDYLAIKVDVQ